MGDEGLCSLAYRGAVLLNTISPVPPAGIERRHIAGLSRRDRARPGGRTLAPRDQPQLGLWPIAERHLDRAMAYRLTGQSWRVRCSRSGAWAGRRHGRMVRRAAAVARHGSPT